MVEKPFCCDKISNWFFSNYRCMKPGGKDITDTLTNGTVSNMINEGPNPDGDRPVTIKPCF